MLTQILTSPSHSRGADLEMQSPQYFSCILMVILKIVPLERYQGLKRYSGVFDH